MSASVSETAPVTAAAKPPLNLVLLGLPGSGKTALLAALTQAAQKQPDQLDGPFISLPDDLGQTSHASTASGRGPGQQVRPYSVVFQPNDSEGPLPATILDCSGQGTDQLLRDNPSLDRKGPARGLARTVGTADGLVLLIDATASPEQLDRQFALFGEFLYKLEEGRSLRTEVSGLPVFLVLTKCDLLADPKDTIGSWMEQIEQRKREVGDAFRAFLAREGAGIGHVPFGQIDLNVWATATTPPTLARAPTSLQEPFGVAELFSQSLEKAAAYRDRREKAGRRLFWTASSAAGLVVLMASVTTGLAFYNQEKPPSELEARLVGYRFADPASAAERLRQGEDTLKKNRNTLKEIEDDPGFATLPDELKEYVKDRDQEIVDYLDYRDRIIKTPDPANLSSVAVLRAQRKTLETELKPKEEWKETPAGVLHRQLLSDSACLQSVVEELSRWFRDNGRKAQSLWTFESEDLRGVAWNNEAEELLAEIRKQPFADNEFLPCSERIKPTTAQAFDEVGRDRDYFERMRDRLVQVRNQLAVLGMLGPVTEPPPLLVLPRPFTLNTAKDRAGRLKQAYPTFEKDLVLTRAPDKLRGEVAENARLQSQTLLEPARQLVAKKQMEAGWEGVRDWLKNPEELADWGILADVLDDLQKVPDRIKRPRPIPDLRQFLNTDRFTLYPSAFILTVPEDLKDKIANNASLTITSTGPGEEPQKLVYGRDQANPRLEGGKLHYTFSRKAGTEIVYKPGDELQTSLPLLSGEMLRWASKPSASYQFGRWLLPPLLHRNTEPNSQSSVERRISLRMQGPEETTPRVPDLLPHSAYE